MPDRESKFYARIWNWLKHHPEILAGLFLGLLVSIPFLYFLRTEIMRFGSWLIVGTIKIIINFLARIVSDLSFG